MATRHNPASTWRARLRRWLLLYVGLSFGGFSLTLFVRAGFGLDPWDVLHQGISYRTAASLGTVVVMSSVAVLLLWIPLRQRPGFGTLADVVVIGVVIDATMPLVPEPTTLAPRVLLLVAALALNGLSTSMYVGAGMGPGPRDGLMTGIAARGRSIRVVRISIDVSVLSVGWLLGGTVGIGTVASALTLGPIVHQLLPRFAAIGAGTTSPATTPAMRGDKTAVARQPAVTAASAC